MSETPKKKPSRSRDLGPTAPLDRFFGPGGAVAGALTGYEPRAEQVQVAQAVESALKHRHVCLAEAGTGVGKTLAYLVPAVRAALRGERTIISTHTINLQNQLMEKDIPLVLSLFPGAREKVPYALMKGRGNYLCKKALEECKNDLFLLADSRFRDIKVWAAQDNCRGDVADLPFSFSSWTDVTSSPETCSGQQCPQYQQCHYFDMRREAAESQIIVVNHALFLADLAVRVSEPMAGVLPHYHHVVFDEAHHLEEAATRAFGLEFGSRRLGFLMDRIRRIPGLDLDRAGLDTIEELSARLFDSFRGAGRAEFYLEEVAHGEAKTRIEEIAAQTCASISRLQNDLLEKAEHDEGLRERIEGMARLCGTAREDLDRLVFGAADNCIRWGAASNPARFGRAEPRVSLHITPISVAPTMQQCFWDRMENEGGVVMLSATLANSGGFSFVRSRLGVPETATECIVGSPFDYRKQAMLYVPGHLAPPAKGPTDVGPIADEIERILALTSGRAFLLFTSWSVLNGVYDLLRLRLPFPLFKQGDQPPARLVDEFRTSGNGCLFGVQTFWEGVDVPGDALSCVIIDRIPFAVPDSPTTKARIQAIEAAGGDSFREFSIPQAQIRLKQGFGRLVRSRADRGIVCILDTRLISRGYGAEFVTYLPPASRASKWARVVQFWHEDAGSKAAGR